MLRKNVGKPYIVIAVFTSLHVRNRGRCNVNIGLPSVHYLQFLILEHPQFMLLFTGPVLPMIMKVVSRLFYESALNDHENAFRNITKKHEKVYKNAWKKSTKTHRFQNRRKTNPLLKINANE